MRILSFVLPLLLIGGIATWLIVQMVFRTDPSDPGNVALVLLLLFLASGSLIATISWLIIARIRGASGPVMALRHGAWGGLFVITLPLLRWLDAFSPLVIGAVLLILFGLESLFLLQIETRQRGEKATPGQVTTTADPE